MPDNLRHAQYDADTVQIDDPQVLNRLIAAQIAATQSMLATVAAPWPMELPKLLAAPPALALGVENAATVIATAIDIPPDHPGFNYIGSPIHTQGSAWKMIGYWPNNTAVVGSTIIECELNLSDATGRFEIILQDNTSTAIAGFRLAIKQVDGSWGYASAQASFVAPATTNTKKYRGLVTLGAAGKYTIRIECNAGCGFWGLAMLPADTITNTPKRRKKYLVVTDSYGTTSSDSGGYLLTADAWPNKLRYLTGYDIAVASAGSCGWVYKGAGALLKVNDYLKNCIVDLLALGPLDGVIFAIGYNDVSQSQAIATISAEVTTAVATCRGLLPAGEIIALSPWTTKTLGGTSIPYLLATRDAIKDTVLAGGGRFVDLLSLPVAEFVNEAWSSTLQSAVLAAGVSLVVATAPAPYATGAVAAGRAGWWVYIDDGINSEMRIVTAMGTTDPRTLTVGALTYAHAAGTPVYIGGPAFITGTGKQGTTVGDGTADRFLGTDGLHPTVAGHENIALITAGQLGKSIAS